VLQFASAPLGVKAVQSRGGEDPPQPVGPVGQPGAPAKGAGDPFCLVVAALGLPVGVQGHSHHLKAVQRFLLNEPPPPELLAQPISQLRHLIVLEHFEGAPECARVSAPRMDAHRSADDHRLWMAAILDGRCASGAQIRTGTPVAQRAAVGKQPKFHHISLRSCPSNLKAVTLKPPRKRLDSAKISTAQI
jgi:hypothetical protein